MEKIMLNNVEFELIEDNKNTYSKEIIEKLYTPYFDSYDYILGDRAYGKIRLKGFCNKNNKNFNEINDINTMKNYLKTYCARDCGYFILKKTIQN